MNFLDFSEKSGGGDSPKLLPAAYGGEGSEFFLFFQPGRDLFHLADPLVKALDRCDIEFGDG
jgi:hypothetical protein